MAGMMQALLMAQTSSVSGNVSTGNLDYYWLGQPMGLVVEGNADATNLDYYQLGKPMGTNGGAP